MELKVWVEGIQRIVCGVTEATTCHDVVYALAHATGKTGRFNLVERWRHNERLLSPNEHPLKVLAKWGEYSSDVQFILRQTSNSALNAKSPTPTANNKSSSLSGAKTPDFLHNFSPQDTPILHNGNGKSPSSNSKSDIKKSFTFSGGQNSGELPLKDISKDRDQALLNKTGDISKDVPGNTSSSTSPPHSTVQSSNKDIHSSSKDDNNTPHHGLNMSMSVVVEGLEHFTNTISVPPYSSPSDQVTTSPHSYGIAITGKKNWISQQQQQQQMVYPSGSSSSGGGTVKHNNPSPVMHVQSRLSSSPSAPGQFIQHPQQSVPNKQQMRPPPYPDPPSYPRHKNTPPQPQQQQQRGNNSIGNSPITLHGRGENIISPSPSSPTSGGSSGLTSGGVSRQSFNMGTPKSRRNLLSEFNRHDLEEEFTEDPVISRGEVPHFQNRSAHRSSRSAVLINSDSGRDNKHKEQFDINYRELIRLVNLQREKLDSQQADITHFDAEIHYWEEKQKENQRQIQYMEKEIRRLEFSGRDIEEELTQLDKRHLEGEIEIGKQQEKTLASELTLLRSKLANCETELLQCKNKIRQLLDDINEEKQLSFQEEKDREREIQILGEIEELQRVIQGKIRDYDTKIESSEKLGKDVWRLEVAIAEKKKQVEDLVREMKAANLESLTFTPSEEIRHLLEGNSHKGPGSGRKIVGSPRQLENAVPTSKNPHGVWV